MTAHSTTPAEIPGAAGAPTPTPLSPDAFAAECRHIVDTLEGDAAHRALDSLVTRLLSSLGYSEGLAVFIGGVRRAHAS